MPPLPPFFANAVLAAGHSAALASHDPVWHIGARHLAWNIATLARLFGTPRGPEEPPPLPESELSAMAHCLLSIMQNLAQRHPGVATLGAPDLG